MDIEGISPEIWAASQLMPGEGIEDGVRRIKEILRHATFFEKSNNQVDSTDALCDECKRIGRNGEHSWYCRKCGDGLERR